MTLDECCTILGVSPTATSEELKTAYRDLVMVWHPDRFPASERLRQKASERLKDINEAYRLFEHVRERQRADEYRDPGNFRNAIQHVQQSDRSASAKVNLHELLEEQTLRIFADLIDARRIFSAHQLAYPKLMLVAQRFNVDDPGDIRIVIDFTMTRNLNAGWVFTRSRLISRGFLTNGLVDYESLRDWNFSLKTSTTNYMADRLWAKLSGDTHILQIEGKRGSETISTWGDFISDTQMMKLHKVIQSLEELIR